MVFSLPPDVLAAASCRTWEWCRSLYGLFAFRGRQ
jgi:hypothetical protein